VVSVTADIGRSHDTDTYELALLDVTGDGRPDHVLRRGSTSKTYVKRNQILSHANLLFNVRNRLGGSFELLYEETPNTIDSPHRRVVLRRVEVRDGVDLGPALASPNAVTELRYENGFFHRNEKEFFGFAKVTTTQLDGGTPYRKTEQTYNNRDYALRGLAQRERMMNAAGTVFSDRVITHVVRPVLDAANQPLVANPLCLVPLHPLLARLGTAACTPVLPVALQETETRTEGGALAKTRITKDLTHDRFNNVLTSTDSGDDAIANDDLFVTAAYKNDTSRWILGRPSTLEVRAGTSNGTILRSRTGQYTAQGKPLTISIATGSGTATSQFGYDAFGNLTSITTPPNEANQTQTYTVTYDPVASTYARSVTDAFGYTSSSTFDLRFGAALTETDVNGSQLVRTYDSFGRLTTVRGPYDTAGAPALTMSYFPLEPTPRAVTVIKASAPPNYAGPVPPPTTNVTFVDGFGQAIELRKTAVVDGVLGMTTSGLVQRDSLGRTLKSYHPFFTPGASTAFVATLPPSTPATSTAYDVLDRPTLLTHPDAQTETTTYALGPSPQGALQFKTQHTINMSPANRVREQYADHLGHMRAFVEHPQPTINATTTYDYTPTGELKQIVDAEGNKTTLAYDLRGLRTSFSNPDTGTHQDIFDLMGNRIATITPNLAALGAKIDFIYDRNRLVKTDYPSKTDVSYKYGPPGAPNFAAGRLLSRTDETGTIEYAYGALGETRETHRSLDGPGIPATNVTHAFTFDSLGRQLELKYPDGEVVANTYDAAGTLSEVKGDALYATGIRYDVFGNRTRMAIGKVVTTWSYDPARVRLSNVTSTLQTPGLPKIQNLQYTYDPAGNPTSLVNTLAPSTGKMPGSSSSTFTYDGVDRLVHIVGQADVDGTTNTTYHQTFTYSPSHNLLAKSRVHTVGSTTPPATNFSSTYAYATRPHLPDIVGGLKITYDASGNPIVRNQNGKDQELIWDDDDRLVDLSDEATDVTQHNAYDADGLRVLRVTDGPNGSHTTVFASPYFDVEDGTNLKHIFAGGTRVATYVDDALYFLHSNHLGSTGVVSDADGTIHQSLEYFADGETWIDRMPTEPINGYLFNGKPYDTETGFYDYGQRFYDPRTSLWLGVDPAFLDSTNLALGRGDVPAVGSFAAHNPVRFVDPDGRTPWTEREVADAKEKAVWRRGGGGGFGSWLKENVAPRLRGALRVAGAVAAVVGAAALCSTGVGCAVVVAATAFVASDPAQVGFTEMMTAGEGTSVFSTYAGPDAKAMADQWLFMTSAGAMTSRPRPASTAGAESEAGMFIDANGSLRHSNGRFASTGGSASVNAAPTSTHGNTAGTQEAFLYGRFDVEGSFEKWGITQDLATRYTKSELAGGQLTRMTSGPRNQMLRIERWLVETSPGPLNHESWAGKAAKDREIK
jgi:RHS repeat-associated protein